MSKIKTQGFEIIEHLAVRVTGTRRVAVVTGGPGTGKSFAAADAAQKIAADQNIKVLHLEFPFGTNPNSMARLVARSLGIKPLQNFGATDALEELKAEFRWRHVKLIIADNAHRLDETCREYLLGLVDFPSSRHQVGLLAVERPTKDSLSRTFNDSGRTPILATMPELTADEVISFAVAKFPEIKAEVETLLDSVPLAKVAKKLMDRSGRAVSKLQDELDDVHAKVGGSVVDFAEFAAAVGVKVNSASRGAVPSLGSSSVNGALTA